MPSVNNNTFGFVEVNRGVGSGAVKFNIRCGRFVLQRISTEVCCAKNACQELFSQT
jgi:hypothetical protein